MVAHYDHYRATAMQFSQHWVAFHNPARVIDDLLSQRSTLPLLPQACLNRRQSG
jgi:hypothetical protein